MAGCMVATSLAMAPAMLLAQAARFVDLDGPLLLAKDRDGGLRYDGSWFIPPRARHGDLAWDFKWTTSRYRPGA